MNIPDVNDVYQAVADLITAQNQAGQEVYDFMNEHIKNMSDAERDAIMGNLFDCERNLFTYGFLQGIAWTKGEIA